MPSKPRFHGFHSFLGPHLRAYLDFKRRLGYTSFSRTSRAADLDHYILFRGLRSIQEIDEGFLVNWVHCIPRHSPGTKNKKIELARGLFKYLIRIGAARTNPALRIAYLKLKPYKPHIFTLKEIQQILQATTIYKKKYPKRLMGWTLETMIFLIYACGLRLGEALRLKIQDVDFDQNILSLWETKFHKERLVPFSAATAHNLKAYLARRAERYPPAAPERPFFCHGQRHGRYGHHTIETKFREILVHCGLARRSGRNAPRIHDLRHAFACHRLYKWYQDGHNLLNKLPLLSTYMGHVDIESTRVYLHICRALLREGDRRFQDSFGDPVQKPLKNALKTL